MTIEEKARAYDKALETARGMIEDLRKGEDILAVSELESMFPELKESEDERISREITEFILTHRIDEPNDIEDTNSWLAWLEKQASKPKKVSIWKHWKDGIAGGAEGEQVFLTKIGRVYSISSCLGCECDYIELSELDKLMREEKTKWSDEDEEELEIAIETLHKVGQHSSANWLKSLKSKLEGGKDGKP